MRKGSKKQPGLSLKNVDLWDPWRPLSRICLPKRGHEFHPGSRKNSQTTRQPSLSATTSDAHTPSSLRPATRAATVRNTAVREGLTPQLGKACSARALKPPETNTEFIQHWAFLVGSQRVGNLK